MPQVEVVVADKLIVVDGVGLYFDEMYPHEDHLKYLCWQGTPESGHGLMQFDDDYDINIWPPIYKEEVVPYIVFWQAEKAKRDQAEIAKEAELQKYLNSEEYRLRKLRNERDQRLSLYDAITSQLNRMYRLADTDEQKSRVDDLQYKWDMYAQTLCNMTDAEGSPWDGGNSVGEPYSVPWPEEPPLPKSLEK